MKKPANKGPSLLDKDFVYRNSASTDIAATFRRIRAKMRREVELPGPRIVVALTPKDRKKA